MATHSSVLAWRIPGTREPGGLPSVGSHRVRHDWGDLAAANRHSQRKTPYPCLWLTNFLFLACSFTSLSPMGYLHGVCPTVWNSPHPHIHRWLLESLQATIPTQKQPASYLVILFVAALLPTLEHSICPAPGHPQVRRLRESSPYKRVSPLPPPAAELTRKVPTSPGEHEMRVTGCDLFHSQGLELREETENQPSILLDM